MLGEIANYKRGDNNHKARIRSLENPTEPYPKGGRNNCRLASSHRKSIIIRLIGFFKKVVLSLRMSRFSRNNSFCMLK